jgi:ubiquinol-cytochrome c reductase cytochrome b subunit
VLHQDGSNNPLGISSYTDKIAFFPYFFIKDTLSFIAFIVFFSLFVFYSPNFLGHSDNYIEANPMVTPEHIVPEWYFLPSYAILRSIPNKLLGVLALFASILVLLILPFTNSTNLRSSLLRPLHQKFYWLLIADFILLGYIGQQSPESPFIEVGQIASVYYFAYFLIILPFIGILENQLLKKL